MKIAIISCYKDPDYVRARVLRAGLAADRRVELIVIKNTHKNLLRYPEILLKLLVGRVRDKPDAYVVTFRGYEILPFVLLVAWSKPVVFDEFINAVEYIVYEHHYLKPRGELARLMAGRYSALLRHCELILADTAAHGAYSAALSGVSHSLYRTIPVGTDETVFQPAETLKAKKDSATFEILFIGNMKPLYGLNYVLEAAEFLEDKSDIHFLIVGGTKHAAQAVQVAAANGAHVTYKPWIAFDKLPKAMLQADLCLAGPFGNTEQAKLVITGKTYQMLALGVPAVIGQSHATKVFSDKVDSLTVPQGDGQALADKILWAYQHRSKLPKIGTAGRKLYDKKFSSEVIAQKLSGLVNELATALNDRGRGR